ncbi:MAG: DUF4231 domain-containing protein [Pseudomonadota bacterium]
MLEQIARRQAELSATSSHLKTRLDLVRRICFALALAAAALAAIASGVQFDVDGDTKVLGLMDAEVFRRILAGTAATMLTVTTFLTQRFLSQGSIELHVTARQASEALKREAFLFATGAGPYAKTETRDDALADALTRVQNTVTAVAGYEKSAQPRGSIPTGSLNVSDYMTERVVKQIAYYDGQADKMQEPANKLRLAELVLSLLAVVITGYAAATERGVFDVAALTAVITTFTSTIIAHLKATRYEELIASYRDTANRLGNVAARGQTKRWPVDKLATAIEDVIQSETHSWQSIMTADADDPDQDPDS